MSNLPYDQALARILIKPLVNTPVHPNHISLFSLAVGLAGSWLMTRGTYFDMAWGATLFAIARFLDHFDGELARAADKKSKLGYYLDYFVGGTLHATFFGGTGIGLAQGWLGHWGFILGGAGAACSIIAMFLNVKLDEAMEKEDGDTVGYPGFWRFELEDGTYLIAPIAWLAWLDWFFILVGTGATVYLAWTFISLVRARTRTR